MLRAAGRLVPAGGRAGSAGSCSLRGCAPFGGVAGPLPAGGCVGLRRGEGGWAAAELRAGCSGAPGKRGGTAACGVAPGPRWGAVVLGPCGGAGGR